MNHFKVVLQDREGRPRPGLRRPDRGGGSPSDAAALEGRVGAFSASTRWFRPEPVRVLVSRSVRRSLVPGDWELSLGGGLQGRRRWRGRAAAVTLAAGVAAGLAGPARAAEEPLTSGPTPRPALPGAESSSLATYCPTDHPPRLTLVEARPVRTGASFEVPPLTDARGNPILLAAFHSNTAATPHTNTFSEHSNVIWNNHSNSPASHTDAAWTNHSNSPGGSDSIVPIPGEFVF